MFKWVWQLGVMCTPQGQAQKSSRTALVEKIREEFQ